MAEAQERGKIEMKGVLLLLAVALVLSACQSASGDVEKYRRDHDRYMRTHEPKTGGPDL
jgi:hypothetical protein